MPGSRVLFQKSKVSAPNIGEHHAQKKTLGLSCHVSTFEVTGFLYKDFTRRSSLQTFGEELQIHSLSSVFETVFSPTDRDLGHLRVLMAKFEKQNKRIAEVVFCNFSGLPKPNLCHSSWVNTILVRSMLQRKALRSVLFCDLLVAKCRAFL